MKTEIQVDKSNVCETKKSSTPDIYRKSRFYYILEAAVEYFIAILVGTTYLAKLTTSIGISDGVTGILTSFISLGFGFQIFALFIAHKKPIKKTVTIMHLINQLCFTFLYVVPIFDIPTSAKTAIFIILLLAGEIIQNIIFSPKYTWMMGLVDDDKRGTFTAKKEIVSLLSGMIVSLIMGAVIDGFEAKGKLKVAFILCGATMLALTAIHTALLILTKEKEIEAPEHISVKLQLKEAVSDKNLLKLIPLFVLWNMAIYSTTPFYGTYQLKELGFSMTLIAVLAVVNALSRSVFSIPLGKFADKYSFLNMLNICFGIMIIAYVMNIFAGKAFFIIYGILYAVAMAGINSGSVNLIYDYTPHTRRTAALAIKNTVAGFAGFFSTLAVKPLVDHIQKRGNKFLGFEHIYAQQVLSFIGMILVILIIIYLNVVIRRLEKPFDMLKTDDA